MGGFRVMLGQRYNKVNYRLVENKLKYKGREVV